MATAARYPPSNPLSRKQSFDERIPDVQQQPIPLTIGCRVLIPTLNIRGTLRFRGETQFKPGIWAGIELDDDIGKNDGEVKGVRYFQCPPQRGLFILAGKVMAMSAPRPSRPSKSTRNVPQPTAMKRSIPARQPSNKSSLPTRPPSNVPIMPMARSSASPAVPVMPTGNRRASHHSRQQQQQQTGRSSASPAVNSSPSPTAAHANNKRRSISTAPAKRASAVRIASNVHVIDTPPPPPTPSTPQQKSSTSPTTRGSVSASSSASHHLADEFASSSSSSSASSNAYTPPSSSTSNNNNHQMTNSNSNEIKKEELHHIYDMMQKIQRERDNLVEKVNHKDAAFERLVSAKESYALQVEDKTRHIQQLQAKVDRLEATIAEMTQSIQDHESQAAQRADHHAAAEQSSRRIQKLEQLVASLQAQVATMTQERDQRASEHASQIDLLRRELDQEKDTTAALEKECDSVQKTSLETLRAYELSLHQERMEHARQLDERDLRLQQTQAALEQLKKQLHSFDELDFDDDLVSSTISAITASSAATTTTSKHQQTRLEEQLDITMTQLENERDAMRQLVHDMDALREDAKQQRRHQHNMEAQYQQLQKDLANELAEKRRLMEETDATTQSHAKMKDELDQLRVSHASMEKEWRDAMTKLSQLAAATTSPTSPSPANTANAAANAAAAGSMGASLSSSSSSSAVDASPNLLQQQLTMAEQQSQHWKDQYHQMEQECMRLMDEMLAMGDDPTTAATATPSSIKKLQDQMQKQKLDYDNAMTAKQVEIQKLSKELADLEAIVEGNVFGQGDLESALEEEKAKVKRLERQLAAASLEPPRQRCELCDEDGHEMLTCRNYKKTKKVYCDYCEIHGAHDTIHCPNQEETF
ncbi:hypothetical protein BC940DRAFT_318326 [Gongronella butleri]|nr:hypothetical protein BC940DRAFT_318326 [Gongronella butleri]